MSGKSSWRVRTCHATWIEPDAPLGTFVHAPRQSPGSQAFLLRGPAALGLMIGFHADGDGAERPLMRRVRVHDIGEDLVNLSDPHTGLFWCAGPLGDAETGVIVVDRTVPQAWEAFALEPIGIGDIFEQFPFLEPCLDLLDDSLLEDALARLLSKLEHERLSDEDLDVLRCCTLGLADGIERLMAALDLSSNAFDLAQRLCVGRADGEAIRRLEEWLADRDGVAPPQVLSTELDGLVGVDFVSPTLPRSVVGALRSRAAPRKRACLVATARNEGPYLLEWIAYHLAIGFERIFIYANDNDDGSDALLSLLASHGVVTFIDNQVSASISSQTKSYSHALSVLPHILDYEWALFCDLDEFFVFDVSRYGNLQAFLAPRDASCDAIALQWLWFGNNGARHLTESGLPYTHRFNVRHAEVNPHIKTMCRPRFFHHAHPHYPFAIRGIRPAYQDCEGEPYQSSPNELAFSTQPNADAAGINHYVYKSIEDCLWKFCRNTGDRPLVSGRRAAEIADEIGARLKTFDMGRSTVVDERIVGCLPDLRSAMREMRGLNGVDAATARVEEVMRKRVGELRAELVALAAKEQTEFAQITIGLLRGEDLYRSNDANVVPG